MFSFIIYVFVFISTLLWKAYFTMPFKDQPIKLLYVACVVSIITIILFVFKMIYNKKK